MQSSTMVVIRTLVMMAALVAVPVAALFGSSIWARLAKVVAVLQEDLDAEEHGDHAEHDHEHEHGHPHEPADGADPAHALAGMMHPPGALAPPATPGQSASPAGPITTPYMAPPADAFSAGLPTSPPTQGPTSTEPAASLNATPHGKAQLASPAFWPAEPATAAAPIAQTQAHAPLSVGGRPPAMAANQAAYIAPADSTPMPPPPAYPDEPAGETSGSLPLAANQATPTTPDSNQTAIEQRLQALGALHYRLETAGQQGELFRFQCKMGLQANPNYVGYFEATSSDSMTAMQQVLGQVESWRAGVVRR